MPYVTLNSKDGYEGPACVEVAISVPLDADQSNNVRSKSFFVGELQPYDGYTGSCWTYVLIPGVPTPIDEGPYRIYVGFQGPGGPVDIQAVRRSDGATWTGAVPVGEMRFFDSAHLGILLRGSVNHKADLAIVTDNVTAISLEEKHIAVCEGGQAVYTVKKLDDHFRRQPAVFGIPSEWNPAWAKIDPWTYQLSLVPLRGTAGFHEFWIGDVSWSATASSIFRYGDGSAVRAKLTVLPDNPPETRINTGSEGTISAGAAAFTWTGTDDWTASGNLEYAHRLDPLEPDFGPFSASVSVTYSDLSERQYTFYVKARDNAVQEDESPAERSFSIDINRSPSTPVNEYPAPTQSSVGTTPILMGSAFEDSDTTDSHTASQFHLWLDGGSAGLPSWDSDPLVNGVTSALVPEAAGLSYNTKYWWQCRYQDNNGAWGPWSGETSFVTQGLPPEVVVFELGGGETPNNQSIPIDFGTAPVNQPGPSKTLTIHNQGEETLFLGLVTIPDGFSVIQPQETALGAEETTTFEVALLTDTEGTFSGDVIFRNNDSDEDPYNFSVYGEVIPIPTCEITVSGCYGFGNRTYFRRPHG